MARDNEPGMGRAKGTTAHGNGRTTKYSPRNTTATLRFASVSAEQIRDAIDAITRVGDAVLFSRTASGDCLVFTVCSGNERTKFYARSSEEVEAVLADMENQASEGI